MISFFKSYSPKLASVVLCTGFILISALYDTQAAENSSAPASVVLPLAAATLPLPEQLRADATVVSRAADGTASVLRKGSNGMVCISTSRGDTFAADCYGEKFFDLFEHARALGRKMGTRDNTQPVFDAMAQEFKSGKLILPDKMMVGFAMSGPISGYDPASNSVNDDIKRWQMIHVPFATGKTTGLPEQHSGNLPWVMAAGSWMAHIMVEH